MLEFTVCINWRNFTMATPANHSPAGKASPNGWIGVDLDGTLANYDSRHGVAMIGKAIEPTLLRIKQWLDMGIEVRIFTARAAEPELIPAVHRWLIENGLPLLNVTCRRDRDLMQLWDDRAIQIECNTGVVLTPKQYITFNGTGWIGVELDGTLAHYEVGQNLLSIGKPVDKMLLRVQQWLMAGIDVRLFTARAAEPNMIPVIETWLKMHQLEKMAMTCEKDFTMMQFWDDRGIRVVCNSGKVAAELHTITTPKRKYPYVT